MAITIVGTAQSGGTNNGNDTTLTFDGSPAEGDYVFVHVGHGFDRGVNPVPTGYTPIIEQGFTEVFAGWSYKKLGATPDTEVVCPGTGNADDALAAGCIVLRGVDPTTPLDTTALSGTGTHGVDSYQSSAITTVTDGAWVLVSVSGRDNTAVASGPTGYSNFVNRGTTDANRCNLGMASKEIATAGTETPGTFSASSQTDEFVHFTVAIRPAGAGSDTNITTNAPDALVLTEQQATVNAETSITTNAPDALVLTEQTATVNAETSFTTNAPDALTLTEYTATVSLGVEVQATTDALTLTENAATVNAENSITANVDALTLTEQTATVNAETSITTNVDALTLTEYAASVGSDTEISAGVAALTLTEYTATVETGGDVVLTPGAAVVTTGSQLFSDVTVPDPISVSAQPFLGTVLTPAAAQGRVFVDRPADSEFPVAFTHGIVTVPGATNVSASINAPAHLVDATTDALTLTENTATISLHRSVSAGVDSLALTENAATVNAALNIAAGVDALTLTAYIASLSSDTNVEAAVAALTLTSYTAGVNAETSVSAGLDALTLATLSATVSGVGAEIFAAQRDTLGRTGDVSTMDSTGAHNVLGRA